MQVLTTIQILKIIIFVLRSKESTLLRADEGGCEEEFTRSCRRHRRPPVDATASLVRRGVPCR